MANKNTTESASSSKNQTQRVETSHQTSSNTTTRLARVWRWCWITGLKLSLALVLGLIIYVIYLDEKITTKFEGQRWELPRQVYGKVQTLAVGKAVSFAKLTTSLQLMGYRQVTQVNAPAEFSLVKHQLVIFQRAFDFGYGIESATRIVINERNGKISSLLVNNENLATVQLEPVLLARLLAKNKEDRILTSLENIPEKLQDTLLLVEDRNFYFHHGVAPLGILRALVANIIAGRTVQGGSTLTQQLVKNMFLNRQRTITRKINEALMALILEYRYSKDQLLEAYVNEVYLGQNGSRGIYGFGLGAQFYFGKSLAQLTNAQIALLVGEIKGPSFYDPWRHPERALKRRDLVLRLMFEQHYINRYEYQLAVNSPLTIRKQRKFQHKSYPAYLQLVKQELTTLLANLPKQIGKKSGLRIFTGFSINAQQQLEQTISQQLTQLEQQHKTKNLQAAMLVTNIENGEIQALAGARKHGYAGFNRALHAKRPIGSLIKPAVYLAALERYQHYNLATLLDDKPLTIENEGNTWQPKNYDGKYRGQVNLFTALVHSLNVPTVNLGMALGLDKVAEVLFALGYNQDISLRPSMLLGALNMSPYEINQLYLPIAAQGHYIKQHAITALFSGDGEIIWQAPTQHEQRLSLMGSYLLNYALQQVTQMGTAKSLVWRLPKKQLAGKTGTTNKLRDSWFVGFDAKQLVTTWVGRDDNQPTKLTGSSGALVLFANYMNKQGVQSLTLTMPDNVKLQAFEKTTGNAVAENCDDIIKLPAVAISIVEHQCQHPIDNEKKKKAKSKKEKRSWFERLFGL